MKTRGKTLRRLRRPGDLYAYAEHIEFVWTAATAEPIKWLSRATKPNSKVSPAKLITEFEIVNLLATQEPSSPAPLLAIAGTTPKCHSNAAASHPKLAVKVQCLYFSTDKHKNRHCCLPITLQSTLLSELLRHLQTRKTCLSFTRGRMRPTDLHRAPQ